MPNTMVAATVRTTQIQLRVKEMTLLGFAVAFAERPDVVAVLASSGVLLRSSGLGSVVGLAAPSLTRAARERACGDETLVLAFIAGRAFAGFYSENDQNDIDLEYWSNAIGGNLFEANTGCH